MRLKVVARSLPREAVRDAAGAQTMPRWLYGYGLYQGAAAACDSLYLLFAAKVLGSSPAAIGLLDAVESVGYVIGAVSVALLVRRFPNYRAVMVAGLAATAIPLMLFASVNALPLAFLLASGFGLFWALPNNTAPTIATHHLPRSQWGAALGQLNKAGALGGATGLAIAALWLAIGNYLGYESVAIRLLFVALGAVAIKAALFTHHSLARAPHLQHHGEAGFLSEHHAARESVPSNPAAAVQGKGAHLLTEQLLYFYILSFMLFIGLGMSFSGVHTYAVQGLGAPVAVVMVAIFGFRLAVYLASGWAGRGMSQVLPLQLASLADVARALLVVAVAATAFLPVMLALPATVALVTLWGVTAAFLSVTGVTMVCRLANASRRGEAVSMYGAVTNGGIIIGVWLAGLLAEMLGFHVMFLIAAALTGVAAIVLLRS